MITCANDVAARMPGRLLAILKRMPNRKWEYILVNPQQGESQKTLYRDACAMTQAGISAEDQVEILTVRFDSYYRPIEPREIENAVRNASGVAVSAESRPPAWPTLSLKHRADAVAEYPNGLNRLRAASPVADPHKIPTTEIIDRLFSDESIVCFGTKPNNTFTDNRKYFRGAEANLPFLIANEMSGKKGLTKDGRISNRCLTNVGPQRRLVIEYDTGTLDEQAALHLHCRDLGVKLLMVVFSGSKSLHGWFDAESLTEEERKHFLRYAALLGADRATFSPIQLVRTPNAWREKDKKQTVEFFYEQ